MLYGEINRLLYMKIIVDNMSILFKPDNMWSSLNWIETCRFHIVGQLKHKLDSELYSGVTEKPLE